MESESSTYDRTTQCVTDLSLTIQRHPLEALGVGFLAGFVIGGGQRSRVGQWLVGLAARFAVRQVTMAVVSEALRET
jgi:hypothetical protein